MDKREPNKHGDEYIVTAMCPDCGRVREVIVSFTELWAMRSDRRPRILCDYCLSLRGGPIAEQILRKAPERNP